MSSGASVWLLFSIAALVAGALVVWHEVGRNKQLGFMLLKKYEELLTRAREEKAKELARTREQDEQDDETPDHVAR